MNSFTCFIVNIVFLTDIVYFILFRNVSQVFLHSIMCYSTVFIPYIIMKCHENHPLTLYEKKLTETIHGAGYGNYDKF